ncbi:MAG: hypothetical protein AB7P33_11220 [Dehalococcoidia bacterium]
MKRGILRDFDSGSYTATVEIDGSIATYLGGVPVARNIASGDLVSGRSVAVWFFDVANPESAVVLAVWV